MKYRNNKLPDYSKIIRTGLGPDFYGSANQTAPTNYQTYIASAAWKQCADAAKARAGWRCQVCNKSSTQVALDAHHRTYERLGRERDADITVLCHECHAKFHDKP